MKTIQPDDGLHMTFEGKSIYDSIYWKMPVLAQKFMGVWPYTNKAYDKFMRIIVYISLYMLIVPLGIRLFEEIGIHADIVIENLVGEMYLNAGVIKFSMAMFNKKKQKKIYDLIEKDWKMTSDEEELQIMEKHAAIGRAISLAYGICCCSTAGCFLSMPTFYPLLDYIVPLENETRPVTLPYYAQYYIDQRKYYFPLMIKAAITGTLSMVVFISYDMAFAMCVQHVCSLFDIINLRLQRAANIDSNIEKSMKSDGNHNYEAHRYIIESIQLHQIVIENVNSLEDAYNLNWFFILLLNTTAVGGGLLILLLKLSAPAELFRYGTFIVTVFIHKYFIFLPGQKIINYSLDIFDQCYACNWYNLSPKSKVLIRIMMARSLQPCYLTGGKMFLLCMETYSSMMKTGMSYFTVFASTQ